MKLCDTCGNELSEETVTCPFCGSHQTAQSAIHVSGAITGSDTRHQPVQQKAGKKHTPGKKHGAGGLHDAAEQQIMDVNLKAGNPRVEQALDRLDIKIREARMQGFRLIKVVHGWGSSGEGGHIKAALPSHLDALKKSRAIRSYLPGENYSNTAPQGQHLISKYPELQFSIRPDRRNPGITFIEL